MIAECKSVACIPISTFSNIISDFHRSGVHYYLNTSDNTVSWLPPSHPKAVVSKSAAQLRKETEESQPIDGDGDDIDEPTDDGMDVELPTSLQVSSQKSLDLFTQSLNMLLLDFRIR